MTNSHQVTASDITELNFQETVCHNVSSTVVTVKLVPIGLYVKLGLLLPTVTSFAFMCSKFHLPLQCSVL